MSERRLTPRQQYEVAYCQLRLNGGHLDDDVKIVVYSKAQVNAFLSYGEREAHFSGWHSPRLQQFIEGVAESKHSVWSIPF